MTLFDKIISGEMKSWPVWEDDNYLAFLTPYPNTPGFTVVIPKVNTGDYLFSLSDNDYNGLHGKLAGETEVWSAHQEFYPEYVGYVTSVEGPKMADEEMNEIQAKIRNVA